MDKKHRRKSAACSYQSHSQKQTSLFCDLGESIYRQKNAELVQKNPLPASAMLAE